MKKNEEFIPHNQKEFENALNMVAWFEGFRPRPYLCPAGYLTIGYGHRLRSGESHAPISKDVARTLLLDDFGDCLNYISKIFPNLWDCQLFALASLSFNLGYSWLNENRNLYREVKNLNNCQKNGCTSPTVQYNVLWYLNKYVNAKDRFGKPHALKGLVKRRDVESDMFKGLIKDFREYINLKSFNHLKLENYE